MALNSGAESGAQADDDAPIPGASQVPAPVDDAADKADMADTEPADTEAADTAAAKPGKPSKRRPFWRDFAVIIVVALVLVILLKAFVVQVFSIPSGSMENTLEVNDRILVSRVVYDFRPIERGDIVVFSGAGSWDAPTPPASNWFTGLLRDGENLIGIAGPSTDYVKRVIGVPGDHVVCCNSSGQITVNGVPLSESQYIYPGEGTAQVQFNITVPAGRLWVMGDNRGDSADSRYRSNQPGDGTIPESAVVGRAFLIIWPLSRINDLPIPNTFKQPALSTAAAVSSAPPAAVAGGIGLAGAGLLAGRRRRQRRKGVVSPRD